MMSNRHLLLVLYVEAEVLLEIELVRHSTHCPRLVNSTVRIKAEERSARARILGLRSVQCRNLALLI